jgi:hypothetical protein
MRRLALVALLATAPATVAAQTTQVLLDRAIAAYEAFNVEQARPIFAQIVSPSNINQVSPEQKVLAYKYLGASWAVLAQTDSALRYFVAALDFDPFTDLDPVKFSASELGPFGVAKTQLFRVGIRPVKARVVNPRSDSSWYQFTITTTHRANVELTLVRQNEPNAPVETIFSGQSDGQRVIAWDGRLKVKGGAVADSGTYLLTLKATSSLPAMRNQEASEPQLLRIEQSFDPLEDSLPTLPDSMLLPERIKTQEPWFDLANGVLVGAASYILPAFILKKDPMQWQSHAGLSIGISIGAGATSFFYRNSRRAITANVVENTRRKDQRARYNQAIAARNAIKLNDMLLIITPLTVR